MFTKLALSLSLLGGLCMVPARADDFSKLNFNIGGGITTPLNPTALYTGLSGNFVAGAGYNLDKKNSIIGEFMWSGMPPNLTALHPINAPFGSINLYTLTANYRHSFNNIGGSHFGAYVIGGGGWYYRYASVDKNFIVPPNTVCQPIYTWWGYGCDTSGFVFSETVAFRGTSAGGINAGAGFTIRLSDSGWKFYIESRYHYAWSPFVPTTQVPVTFGFRFN